MTPAKRPRKGWISANFFEGTAQTQKVETKPVQKRSSRKPSLTQTPLENVEFFKKLEPETVEDLAVHNKKIGELRMWLENNVVRPIHKNRNVPMLLITGPTGTGKTTTLKILCKELKVDIQEWVNPIDSDFETTRSSGQAARLIEFLTEAKFPSLLIKQGSNSKKITLIEDFPNTLQRNPEEFDNILSNCVSNGKSAIVFICTDVGSNNINLAKHLFTDEVKLKYRIDQVSFNPCSATLLKAALKRAQTILQEYTDSLKAPSQALMDAITASTMGDIRCALNQYYFAALKGTVDIPIEFNEKASKLKPGQKRKRNANTCAIKSMSKDEVLGLFHSIGRVLNPKRREHGTSWRIDCDLSALVDEFSIQPNIFNAFLYENYLKYFGDIEDAQRAVDALSTSQLLMGKWAGQGDTLILGLWVSVMGLMIFNEHRVSKWNQITGPKKINKVIDKNVETQKLHASDHFYYNLITKKDNFHKFQHTK